MTAATIQFNPHTMKFLQNILITLALAGCATVHRTGRETTTLTRQITEAESATTRARSDTVVIRSNLSRVDGKAAVILEWLKQHRNP